MKKLLLIRHAKAEKETSVKDIDRPLKYIGIQDARFMAERLKENSLIPQLIYQAPPCVLKQQPKYLPTIFSYRTLKLIKLYTRPVSKL